MKNELTVTSNTVAISSITEEQMALSLNQQFESIDSHSRKLFTEIIHFGCALAQAELELDRRGLLKNRKLGQGMQGWLAENCPAINYKTAMRWKGIIVKTANSLGCSTDEAFKILSGEVVDVSAKLAKRRDEIYSAKSQRDLLQMLFNFASEDTGSVGRPSGTSATTGEKLTRTESARRMWAGLISTVARDRPAFYAAAKLLPIDEARNSLAELKELVKALDTRIKEGK